MILAVVLIVLATFSGVLRRGPDDHGRAACLLGPSSSSSMRRSS